LAIAILGFNGYLFISCEVAVIVYGVFDNSFRGMQIHRIEALSAAFFLFALPYYIGHLLQLTPLLKKILQLTIRAGFVVFLLIAIIAFGFPEYFLALSKQSGALITPWNLGRGTPGIVYRIRDILIMIVSLFSLALMIVELKIHKKYVYIFLPFLGTMIAIGTGIIDLILAHKEISTGLFTIRVFSTFTLGLTVFILFSMIAVMKWLIDQTRLIERAKKMESLGLMAGGIAHDFNNLITGIMGNASLAKEHISDKNEISVLLSEIESASVRAKNLAYQLLTFSKGGSPVKNIESIADIVRETVDFVLRGSNVRARFDIPRELLNASVDVNQMSQVVQNIIINAQQAMPEGGFLDIALSNATITTGSVIPQGDYVKIQFKDYGTGIQSSKISSIFDPYYSTKDGGSGLGLSISHSIITSHQGYIDVSSKYGEGATFTVHLPAVKDVKIVSSNQSKDTKIISGRVLIIDDEEIIRTMTEKMLEKIGLQPVSRSNFEEGINAYRTAVFQGEPYTLVLMDLTIPAGISGMEAITILKEYDPSVCAIVSSGYSEDSVLSEYKKYGFKGFLAKPYTFDELKKIVARVLCS